MAEQTGLRNNVLDFPVYGLPYGVVFPLLDADGDLVTGAADLDSEVSKNGDTFADCTNEATEIATNSGMYFLLLTATEMTADVVTVIVKTSTTGAKTTPITLYPQKMPKLISQDTAGNTGNDSTHIHADAGEATDDLYNGAVLHITSGTGSGQARVISYYVGSTKLAAVNPAFATTPDNTSVYDIYATPMCPVVKGVSATVAGTVDANVVQISGDSGAADNAELFFDGTGYAGGTTKLSVEVSDKTGFRLSATGVDDVLDEVVEGAVTVRQAMRVLLACFAGEASGGGTATITYRDFGDTKDRLVLTVDSSGNRSAVVRDLT